MSAHHLNKPLRRRLREYLHRTRHLQFAATEAKLLGMLSPSLQSEVVLLINEEWSRRVWFLANVEAELLVCLTQMLSPMVLAPYELAPSGFLYVLHRGVMVTQAGVLVKGSTWGEDLILEDIEPGLMRPTNARAMNYVEVFVCSYSTLRQALSTFPQATAHVRRCAVRLAMRRHFVLSAQRVLDEQRLQTHASKEAKPSVAEAVNVPSVFRQVKRRESSKISLCSTTATVSQVTLQTQMMNSRTSHSSNTSLLSVSSPIAEKSSVAATRTHAAVAEGWSSPRLGRGGLAPAPAAPAAPASSRHADGSFASSVASMPASAAPSVEMLASVVGQQTLALDKLIFELSNLSKELKSHEFNA